MMTRRMGAVDLLFITTSHSVSFIGKTWWVSMLLLRLLVLLLAGSALFSDEQQTFICNTLQPGCSNVCFDVFSPVSVLRLWLLHLVLLCLLHVMFATYVAHETLSYPNDGALHCDRTRRGSPFTLENSSSSRDLSLSKAPLQELPRFYCTYLLVVVLRMLLEGVFGAGQFLLFGLSFPKSFLCYEAPCTSGVQCYISRPTEKTFMLNGMLGVASLSVLLSLLDLVSSMKAMLRWRRKSETLMEELSKGEQSSVFTAAATEDSDLLSSRRTSPGGSSKDGLKDEKMAGGFTSANEKHPHGKDTKDELHHSPASSSHLAPTHFVLHSHLKPPVSPRYERQSNNGAVRKQGQCTLISGQQSDSNDRRKWV